MQDGRFPFPASDSFHSFNINLVKDKGLPPVSSRKNLSIMEVKTVGIACDHAGFPLKQFVLEYLEKKGYQIGRAHV